MKVDAKWFCGMASSRPYRSFTKQDSEQIIRYTHSVSITVLVDYQLNPIAILSWKLQADLDEYVFLINFR